MLLSKVRTALGTSLKLGTDQDDRVCWITHLLLLSMTYGLFFLYPGQKNKDRAEMER